MLIKKATEILDEAGIEYCDVIQVYQGNCSHTVIMILDFNEHTRTYIVSPEFVAEQGPDFDFVDFVNKCNEYS